MGGQFKILIDTGCTKTMVFADWLDQDCMDYDQMEKILCVHEDMVHSQSEATAGMMVPGYQSCCCSWHTGPSSIGY